MNTNIIYNGDSLAVLKTLPNNSVDCCISSPPYWKKRNYNINGQMGQEDVFGLYILNLIRVYREVYRVLKPEGTCFVNLGDTYNGNKKINGDKKTTKANSSSINKHSAKGIANKCLLMIPQRFAIQMINQGWILRNNIIWRKPNVLPSSAKDRFTVDFENIFFFVKQAKGYYFNQQTEPAVGYDGRKDILLKRSLKYSDDMNGGVKKPKARWRFEERVDGNGEINRYPIRNVRTVWDINTECFSGSHCAVYPKALVKRMVEAGCPQNGIVLDPFMGAGTTALVCKQLHRRWVGIELNKEYCEMANKRIVE